MSKTILEAGGQSSERVLYRSTKWWYDRWRAVWWQATKT